MLSFGTSRLPANIVFGEGQRLALGEICRPFGKRVFICTDAYLAANAEWYAPLLASLTEHGLEVSAYTETEAELPYACLDQAVTAARAFAPDVIVGLGGGSCMDLAKLVSLMLTHGGSVRDYYGELKVPGPIIPVIAVPTTSGTGSEVTPVAVIEDPDRATKVGISSAYLIPVAAICDPEVTYTCPRGLTAAAGADAMTHAVEAFTAAHKPITASLGQSTVFVGKNLLSDEFALIAIRLLTKSLKRAYDDGSDAEARRDVMMAALMAGIAFGTAGTAAAHALQYPVGAITHSAHGLGVATLLPYVMQYNRPSCTVAYAAIARAMSAGDAADSDEILADKAIDALAALFDSVNIPRTLADLKMPEDRIDWAAEQAFGAARLINNNPRTLTVDALIAISQSAFSGNRAALAG